MPKFAHVAASVPCPYCGRDLTSERGGVVAFQWGYCSKPHSGSRAGDAYHPGDEIRWRVDAGGRVPVWRYFEDDTGNIGDPRFGDVLIHEGEAYGPWWCQSCRRMVAHIGVVVRGGVIRDVRAFPEWPVRSERAVEDGDAAVYADNGELIPRPDWYDHPMPPPLASGSPLKLVPNGEACRLAIE